jgi:uncharacterized protein HemY
MSISPIPCDEEQVESAARRVNLGMSLFAIVASVIIVLLILVAVGVHINKRLADNTSSIGVQTGDAEDAIS